MVYSVFCSFLLFSSTYPPRHEARLGICKPFSLVCTYIYIYASPSSIFLAGSVEIYYWGLPRREYGFICPMRCFDVLRELLEYKSASLCCVMHENPQPFPLFFFNPLRSRSLHFFGYFILQFRILLALLSCFCAAIPFLLFKRG